MILEAWCHLLELHSRILPLLFDTLRTTSYYERWAIFKQGVEYQCADETGALPVDFCLLY